MIEVGRTYEDLINDTYSIKVDDKIAEEGEIVNA